MILPASVARYFWDIDTKKATPKKHRQYYTDRILELGDKRAIQWLTKTFSPKKIKDSLKSSKISKKSQNYWRLIFS